MAKKRLGQFLDYRLVEQVRWLYYSRGDSIPPPSSTSNRLDRLYGSINPLPTVVRSVSKHAM